MRIITQEYFNEIYENHQLWINSGGSGGNRAYLNLVDFRNLKIPDKANLSSAILIKSNLSKATLEEANLENADLTYADLSKSNISYANLTGANLTGADLAEANLTGVNFTEAILIDANFANANINFANFSDAIFEIETNSNDKKIINRYQQIINELEKDRIALLTSTENKDAELNNNQQLLNKLKEELLEREKQLKSLLDANKIDNIDKAFETLIKSGSELKEEINLLKKMFYWYFGGVIGSIIFLVCVWGHFFYKVESFVPTSSYNRMDLLDIWINLSPSVLLMGLLLFFIYQTHKCQRHQVILKKLLYKPKQIKGVLEAYIYISGNNEASNIRINKVLDDYVCHIINHDIDTDKEESRLKETDKKDASTNEQLLNVITEVIKKVKL